MQREGTGHASIHPADFVHVIAHMEGDECEDPAAVELWHGWKAQGLNAGLLRGAYAALSRELRELCKDRKVLYLQKSNPLLPMQFLKQYAMTYELDCVLV